MQNLPINYFTNKLNDYQQQKDSVVGKIRTTSIFRILVFIITIIAVYFSTLINLSSVFITLIIGIISFIILINKHLKLYKEKQWLDALIKVSEEEISILKGENKTENSGIEFIDDNHPFTTDLDVFGKKSIFRLINRTASIGGKLKLALTLKQPFQDKEEIELRQQAILDLKCKNEWRLKFQASGKLFDEKDGEIQSLLNWAKEDYSVFSNGFYKSMLIIIPILGFITISLISLGLIGSSFFVLFLIIPFAMIGTKLSKINKQHAQMSKKTSLLEKYSDLFKLVENESFNSERLNNIKDVLINDSHSANHEISELSQIMKSFDYRLNMLMGFLLNIFFLWDIKQLIRLDEWKLKNSEKLNIWFQQLSLIDELNSLAGFNYAFELDTMPEFSQEFKLEAINAAHPFLIGSENVGNPIDISSWNQFYVVTGANMAGKSTYLRTVGANLLLAMTGSAVVADKFVFTPVEIISGIKTTDSLQDGESYFFAELKRLKQIIVRLEKGEKLFVILDEILRGTNSADKQKGSLGLVKQLLKLNASGIIATHDLALGKLMESFPKNITNKRFEVEIVDNELVFDYKIKDGISQNLNATFLMKKMGIMVE